MYFKYILLSSSLLGFSTCDDMVMTAYSGMNQATTTMQMVATSTPQTVVTALSTVTVTSVTAVTSVPTTVTETQVVNQINQYNHNDIVNMFNKTEITSNYVADAQGHSLDELTAKYFPSTNSTNMNFMYLWLIYNNQDASAWASSNAPKCLFNSQNYTVNRVAEQAHTNVSGIHFSTMKLSELPTANCASNRTMESVIYYSDCKIDYNGNVNVDSAVTYYNNLIESGSFDFTGRLSFTGDVAVNDAHNMFTSTDKTYMNGTYLFNGTLSMSADSFQSNTTMGKCEDVGNIGSGASSVSDAIKFSLAPLNLLFILAVGFYFLM